MLTKRFFPFGVSNICKMTPGKKSFPRGFKTSILAPSFSIISSFGIICSNETDFSEYDLLTLEIPFDCAPSYPF